MSDRELTAVEERLIEELGFDRKVFLGESLDTEHFQPLHSLFVAERTTVSLNHAILPQIHGLELSNNRRFGNHMIALSRLLVLAQHLGMRRVFIPAHPLFRPDFVIQGVVFSQSDPAPNHNTLRGLFYWVTIKWLLQDSPKPIELFPLFRGAMLPLCGYGALDTLKVKTSLWWRSLIKRLRNEITIHIRSGDIFSEVKPNPGYWQPPLDFYTTVITEEKPKKVTLVFEDTANPVIPALIEWLSTMGIPYRLEDGMIESAIRELATAHHLVGGRGTFLAPILAMSRSVRRTTVFSDKRHLNLPRVKDVPHESRPLIRHSIVPAGDYETLVSPWANSPEQRDAMLNYALSKEQQSALRAE